MASVVPSARLLRTFLYSGLGLAALLLALPVAADHFRGGSLEVDAAGVTPGIGVPPSGAYVAEASGWLAYGLSGIPGTVTSGDVVDVGDDLWIDWGDGSQDLFLLRATAVDAQHDLVKLRIQGILGGPLQHVYQTPTNAGQPWLVTFEGGKRSDFHEAVPPGTPYPPDVTVHANNPFTPYRLQADLVFPADTQFANEAPRWDMPPVVTCRHLFVCHIDLKATDAEGDPIEIRFATDAEAMAGGGTFYQPGPCPAFGVIHPLPPVQASWTDHEGCGSVPAATLSGAELTWDTMTAFREPNIATYYSVSLIADGGEQETPLEIQIHVKPPCGCSLLSIPAYVLQHVDAVLNEVADHPTHAAVFVSTSAPPGAQVEVSGPGMSAYAHVGWTPPTSLLGSSPEAHFKMRYSTPERVLEFPCAIRFHLLARAPELLGLLDHAVDAGATLHSHLQVADPQGLEVTASLVAAPLVGSMYVEADGSFHYAAPSAFAGPVFFTVRLDNGWAATEAPAMLFVRPDVPPLTAPDVVLVGREPVELPFDHFLLNDASSVGAPLEWAVDTAPALGTLKVLTKQEGPAHGGGPYLLYTPPSGGLKEEDHMTYIATHWGRSSEPVQVTFKPLYTPQNGKPDALPAIPAYPERPVVGGLDDRPLAPVAAPAAAVAAPAAEEPQQEPAGGDAGEPAMPQSETQPSPTRQECLLCKVRTEARADAKRGPDGFLPGLSMQASLAIVGIGALTGPAVMGAVHLFGRK